MRRFTDDPAEVRRWADARGARPGLTAGGDLVLLLPDDARERGTPLRWDEFAGHFTAERLGFVHDEGSDFWLLGPEEDLRQFSGDARPEQHA
jgi:hypothetical protein